jgi:hypothetical protein
MRATDDRPAPLDEWEALSLPDAMSNVLAEARMMLPGVQTLFGFQLIVVFNQRFQDGLASGEHYLHLAAMALIAVATALLVAPATYHRRAEPERVSRRLVRVSTRMLSWSRYPLMIGVCAEFYLVASLITENDLVSVLLAAALLVVFVALWVVMPHARALQRRLAE